MANPSPPNGETPRTPHTAPVDRAELAAKAAREAMLDIVWSNVEIPRAMKAQIVRGGATSAYSKKTGNELVLIGSELRPNWSDEHAPAANVRDDLEMEFMRMHTLRQYGHFLYSDDDMPKIVATATKMGADESIFGLLETLRVEQRMGISMGRAFCWESYYPASEAESLAPVQRPLFHWLREGWLNTPEMEPEAFREIQNFHDCIIGAVDSVEVAELAIEWEKDIFPRLFPQPPKDQQPGEGQPGEGKPGEGKPGEGQPTDPTDPAKPSDHSGTDPYRTSEAKREGQSSLMDHIRACQERDARAEARRAESESKKGPGAKNAAAAAAAAAAAVASAGSTIDVKAPTTAEAESERSGHGYSKTSGKSEASPEPGEWRTMPSNAELLEGSKNFFNSHFDGHKNRIDPEATRRAQRLLERMLTGQSRNVLTDSPAKRMSNRHLGMGEVKYTRREDFSRGLMNLDIVVDCSGSMGGAPIDSARCLLLALSNLASKGLVSGRAIFSSGEGWMACPLPIKPERIAQVVAFSGSEGIQRALTDNVRKLREADAVFVFTDAQITDRAFSKDDLRARKVEPMGLYVGNDGAESNMRNYFDKYLIRSNLDELCLGMVQRFLSSKKMVVATQKKKAQLRR